MRLQTPVVGLRSRLLLIGLLGVIPGLAAIRYLSESQHAREHEHLMDEGRRTASLAADRVGDQLGEALTMLASFATIRAVRASDSAQCDQALVSELVANQELITLVVANRDGSIVCSAGPVAVPSFAARHPAWFDEAFRSGRGVIDGSATHSLGGPAGVIVARPFADDHGRVSKVVAASVRLSALTGDVLPRQLPAGATLTVFDRHGVILSRFPDGDEWIGRTLPPSPLRDSLVRGAPTVTEEQTGVDGISRLYTSQPLAAPVATGLYVGMGIDESIALADAVRMTRLYDLLVVLVAIGSIVAAMTAAHFFVLRPAGILKSVAGRLARGDFSARVDLERLTGMDDLARAMNGMADALAARRLQQGAVERELRRSEDRYRTLFDMNPYPMWVYDRDTLLFIEVNRAAINRYGYTRDEFLAMTILDIRPPEDVAAVKQMLDHSQEEWLPVGTWRHRLRSGEEIDVEINSHPFAFEGRPAVLVAVRDVSDRMKAEAELRKTQERMRFALEASGVGLWEATLHPRETHWSSTLQAMHGLTPGTFGGTLQAFLLAVHPEDRERVLREHRAAVREGPDMHLEYRTLWPNGTVRLIRATGQVFRDAHGRAARVAGVAMDVTEHEAMEEKLRQSQRMEAVGQLAGGVAHDFNNLLMVIDGNTDIAIRALDRDHRARKDLIEVRRSAARAAKLTAQLLAFSRKQTLQPVTVDVDQLIGEVTPMVRRLIGEDIEVRAELRAEGSLTRADRNQLEQALLNLAVNARDAMPNGGILSIVTGRTHLTRADVVGRRLELDPGDYATIVVKDNGCGMDDQTLSRAFEPFFTTKGVGKGTGLGLSSVYGTVRQSGGHIVAESALGIGTAMTIYLPRVVEMDVPDPGVLAPLVGPSVNGATILLVEDERAVRELIARMLSTGGYKVIAADSGAEAIERAELHRGRIDLVLSDVVMPGVPVMSMIDVLRARRGSIRVLLMSGYPDDEIVRRGMSMDRYPILTKPLTADVLMDAVTRALRQNHGDDQETVDAGAVA